MLSLSSLVFTNFPSRRRSGLGSTVFRLKGSVLCFFLLDEPFSNPLAPDGHDVDDSHTFNQ